MAKITDLTEKTSVPAVGDYLVLEDMSASQTKKIQYQTINLGYTPYKFFAYSTSNPSSTTSPNKVQFNNKLYDTGGNFDSVTNFRFTAPIAGFYRFAVNVVWDMAANGSAGTILYKNGSQYIENLGPNGATVQNVGVPLNPPLIQLAANDYIEIYSVATSAGWSCNVGGNPIQIYFGGELASKT